MEYSVRKYANEVHLSHYDGKEGFFRELIKEMIQDMPFEDLSRVFTMVERYPSTDIESHLSGEVSLSEEEVIRLTSLQECGLVDYEVRFKIDDMVKA